MKRAASKLLISFGICMAFAPAYGAAVLLPINCAELLPDQGPFLDFFDTVARGAAAKNKKLSSEIFYILSMRERLDRGDLEREGQNPVDVLIRKTLCFYREQKAPLKPVAYDDPTFVRFLNDSVAELSKKVDDTVFRAEYERLQRHQYELKLSRNQAGIDQLREAADQSAAKTFKSLSRKAKQVVEQ